MIVQILGVTELIFTESEELAFADTAKSFPVFASLGVIKSTVCSFFSILMIFTGLVAALYSLLPAWLAVSLHFPAAKAVTVLAVTLHKLGVDDE